MNTARAKKLAEYILRGQDTKDAFLPTSVFLATDKSLPFNSKDHTLEIDSAAVGSFSVVDGQHRLEGLRMAAEKDARVYEFEIPVVIAIKLSKLEQMCHFLIVNTTQKSVDASIEQRIYARLTAAVDVEELPTLPRWILNVVDKGEVQKALKYVDFLNKTQGSPWFGKIKMANQDVEGGTINQKSFVKAIVKYVLTANNPLSVFKDFEKEKKVFLNYWKAIEKNLDDGNSTVLYKYNGVELFCKFLDSVLHEAAKSGQRLHGEGYGRTSKSCLENVEGEYAGVAMLIGGQRWESKFSQCRCHQRRESGDGEGSQ